MKILKFLSSLLFFKTHLHNIMLDDALDKKQLFTFELREHNPKFLLGILCIIGCPVQLVSKVFWDCICVDTHLPHFDVLTHAVIRSCVLHIHLSNICWGLLILSSYLKPFIVQKFAEVCYSVFVEHSSFKSLLNLRKAYIFHEFAEGLLSICVCWIFKILLCIKPSYFSAFSLENMCDSWCMHQTWLSSSAAIVPQIKFTGLCSSASAVPWSESTEM